MHHLSMFKWSSNDLGYIQVVIKEEFKEEMRGMGFCESIDKIKKPVTRRKKAVKDDK
jgi:hypothetical protein